GGRIDVGFLGAAQIDRFANINTTVIGPYDRPKVRLPGGGGAPEIATSAKETFITLRHSARAFVERLDFVTSIGHGSGAGERARLGITTKGPTRVITDLCVMEPDSATAELTVAVLHPGVARERVVEATGWPIRFAADLGETEPPTESELATLRALKERTARAHAA